MTTHTRKRVLLATTAAFGLLGASLHVAAAQTVTDITGGGSTLASPTYQALFGPFDTSNPTINFSNNYNPSGSGAAQTSAITDVPNVTGGKTPFDFGASDATISAAQLSQWNTGGTNASGVKFGKPVEGLLVEVPTFGTPITIPTNFSNVTANGSINLTDTQLCGVFSGKIQTANDPLLAGSGIPSSTATLTVAYRGDSSGTSFLFTQHLAAVCTSSNSSITFSATTTFANLFTSGVPSNFKSGTGSPGVEGVVASNANALGYLSPDYTKEVASPNTSGGAASFVAYVNGIAPTPTNTTNALATGKPITNPAVNPSGTANNTADPNSFIPVAANPPQPSPAPTKPAGNYPIVGYTTWLLPQCFANANVASGIVGYVRDLYGNSTFKSQENTNGFAVAATSIIGAVTSAYLTSTSSTAVAGVGSTGCTTAGLVGR